MGVALSLVLVLLPDAWRAALVEGLRETILRPVFALQRTALERRDRLADPAALRAERDSLAAVVVARGSLEAENRQLRRLLGLAQRLGSGFVAAVATNVPERATDGLFLLNVGRDDGVQPGMPVVTGAGLVGMVVNVEGRRSVALGWMHRNFAASAMTADGQAYGIVRRPSSGLLGLEGTALVLAGVPRHQSLRPGTLVVTAGRGGIYPRGIPIGWVEGEIPDPSPWQRSYVVRPAVHPGAIDYVLVLGPGRPGLVTEDLLARWGLSAVPVSADTMPTTLPASSNSVPVQPARRPSAQPRLTPPVRRVEPPSRPAAPVEVPNIVGPPAPAPRPDTGTRPDTLPP
jgi:rod shape-determining protein MreC